MPAFPWLSNPATQPQTAIPLNAVQQGGFQYQDPMKGMGLIDMAQYMRQNNPEALMSIAGGLMRGDLASGFEGAGKALQAGRQEQMGMQKEAQVQNQTKQYLMANGYSETDASAAMNNPAILSSLLSRKDYELQQEAQAKYDTDRSANVYGVPQPMIGPNGEGGVAYPRKADGVLMMNGQEVPEGWRTANPYERSFATGLGGDNAKAASDAIQTKNILSSMKPRLITATERLKVLAKTATSTGLGKLRDYSLVQTNQPMSQAGIDREEFEKTVQNIILPMLRPTFGSQFTAKEGEKLETILGDPDKGPEQKMAAIKVYVEQADANLDAASAQADAYQNPYNTGGAAPPGGGAVKMIRDPATGKLVRSGG